MTEMEHSTLAEDEATPVDAGLVMSRKVFALRLGDACPGADAALLKTELLASLETNGRCAGDALWTHGAGDVEKTTRQRELLSLRPRRASNPSVDRGPGSVSPCNTPACARTPPSASNRHVSCPTQRTHAVELYVARHTALVNHSQRKILL